MPSAISQQVLGLATSTSPGLAQAGGYNILPAGIVFPYAGGAAPTGFLLCEGQQIDKTAYAALYASIGDDYATQINPTTGLAWAAPDADKFRVPDYRGLFLRGVGTPSGLDAVTRGSQQADKTKKNGLTATSASSAITALSMNASSLSSGSCAINKNAFNSDQNSHGHTVNSAHGQAYTDFDTPGNGETRFVGSSGNYINKGNAYSATGTTMSWNSVNATGSAAGTANAQSLSSGTVAAQAITVQNGDTETRPINKGVAYIIKA